ncbi:MAG: chromate transporter [Clostridia bacterium]|nr:chromate transporter [Clostridia bacterium]MBQ6233341.1 chromate transporter [Clostridia bacterium]
MIYLSLFWEFLKIGLFAVGGGMATLPFLRELSVRTGWFSQDLITDMIAISESTPGPIGINMATYVGCNIAGLFGGFIATMGELLPSLIIVIIISKSLERFRNAKVVGDAFYGLRPAVTGLIAAAGISVAQVAMLQLELYKETNLLLNLVDWKKLLLFIVMFIGIRKLKWHPVVYIAIAAVVGLIFAF